MVRDPRPATAESCDPVSYLPMARPQHRSIAGSCSPGHAEILFSTPYSVPDRAKERRPWHPSQGGAPWAEEGTLAAEPFDILFSCLGLVTPELDCDCLACRLALAAGR
jgi:hypothetical protein